MSPSSRHTDCHCRQLYRDINLEDVTLTFGFGLGLGRARSEPVLALQAEIKFMEQEDWSLIECCCKLVSSNADL
jgi:hypothetical protein